MFSFFISSFELTSVIGLAISINSMNGDVFIPLLFIFIPIITITTANIAIATTPNVLTTLPFITYFLSLIKTTKIKKDYKFFKKF